MTKRGFTLIELLVVVVVLVTLMAIVFRLAGIIGGQEARAVTITTVTIRSSMSVNPLLFFMDTSFSRLPRRPTR